MLECVGIAYLYRKLADMADDRGHPRSWGFLGPALWIAGEVVGLIVGLSRGGLTMYVYALMGAGVGGAMAWNVVVNLPVRAGSFR